MQREVLRTNNLVLWQNSSKKLNGLHLRLFEGEVLGLVGQTGCGITALFQVLTGEKMPSTGGVLLQNKMVGAKILQQEIGYVNAKSQPVRALTQCENVMIPKAGKTLFGFYSAEKMNIECQKIMQKHGISFSVNKEISANTLYEKHLLCIVKQVAQGRSVILLDSLTSSYTEIEKKNLLEQIRTFQKAGVSFIYASNRWDIILEEMNRVCVIRSGQIVKTFWDKNRFTPQINKYIYGYWNVDKVAKQIPQKVGIKTIEPFCIQDKMIQSGDLMGIFDLDDSADMLKNQIEQQAKADKIQVAVVQSNSFDNEWVDGFSAIDNVMLPIAQKVGNVFGYATKGVRNVLLQECSEALAIPVETLKLPMGDLSRSDKISLLFYRWKKRKPSVFLFLNPTQGCDLEEKREMNRQVEQLLAEGFPVIYCTGDLKELYAKESKPYSLKQGVITEDFTFE